MDLFGLTLEDFEKYGMILVRISTLVATAPFFGLQGVPRSLKAGLTFFIALLIYPFVDPVTLAGSIQLLGYVTIIIKEAIVGILLGFTSGFMFYGLRLAGHFVSFQMGLMLAQTFDPDTGQRIPILGQFYYLMAILIFLTINGHHLIISALSLSYEVIPLGGAVFDDLIPYELIRMGSDVFIMALKIASPVMVTLFLTDVALGIIARTVPQMNIFFVGLPVKIGVGLILNIFILSLFPWILETLIDEMGRNIDMMLKLL